mmetsp:Transcript_51575/g.164927  ORF Transcript_51575/g.164927 Transcript_51575/m.164927 type:complete len:451 (-) Transcript_51575:194-1546(-)
MAVEVGAASQGGDICGPGAHHPACGPRHDPHRHHLHLQVRDDPGGGGARAQRGGLQLLILHLHVPGHRHAVHGRGPARGGGQRGRGEHHQPRHLHRVGSGRSDHRRDTRHRGQRRPRHRLLPRAGGPCLLVPRYPRAGPARRHRSDGGQRRHDGTERQPHPLPRGAAFRGDKHRAGRAVHPRLRHGHRGGGVGHPNLAARRHRVAHGGARKGVPHTRQGPAVLHPPATGHQGLRGTHGPAHGALRRQEPGVHVDPDERDNAGDGAAGGAPARVVRVGGVHIQPGPDRAGCHRLHPLVVPQGPRGGGAAHGGVRGCGGNAAGGAVLRASHHTGSVHSGQASGPRDGGDQPVRLPRAGAGGRGRECHRLPAGQEGVQVPGEQDAGDPLHNERVLLLRAEHTGGVGGHGVGRPVPLLLEPPVLHLGPPLRESCPRDEGRGRGVGRGFKFLLEA